MKGNNYKITIYDEVNCKSMNPATTKLLRTLLLYEKQGYNPFTKRPTMSKKYLIDRQGNFFTGYVPVILDYADRANIKIDIKDEREDLPGIKINPVDNLQGVPLRDYQIRVVNNALNAERGVLLALPRSGKTFMAAAIYKSISPLKGLFLVHTKDLLHQAHEEFTKVGINTSKFFGEDKDLDGDVVVATKQSFSKVVVDYSYYFNVVIVDECHHVHDLSDAYGKILRLLNAKYRFGLTGTLPANPGAKLVLFSLLGPVFDEISIKEGQEKGIVVKPKVRIIETPKNFSITKAGYDKAYSKGVVHDRAFNRQVMLTAREYINDDQTVLILVKRVRHGFNIKSMFDRFTDLDVPFLCGGLDAETEREKKVLELNGRDPVRLAEISGLVSLIKEMSKNRQTYKQGLLDGVYKCCIVTTIWDEGVNIPNLNVVINAGGGKGEEKTIQKATRPLTKYKGKKQAIIVDYFNNNNTHLISHFGSRISIYCKFGWFD